MAKTADQSTGTGTVETDGKGISSPPADEEQRTATPADRTGTSSGSDTAEDDLSTTGKGIS